MGECCSCRCCCCWCFTIQLCHCCKAACHFTPVPTPAPYSRYSQSAADAAAVATAASAAAPLQHTHKPHTHVHTPDTLFRLCGASRLSCCALFSHPPGPQVPAPCWCCCQTSWTFRPTCQTLMLTTPAGRTLHGAAMSSGAVCWAWRSW
jgi:hypothetical protein